MQAFGGPVRLQAGDAADLTSSASAAEDIHRAHDVLAGLCAGGHGMLRLYRPFATAAFAPRDTALAAFPEAASAMRERGFAPVERRTGGQLAVYDSRALVVDLVAPHADPRAHVVDRFAAFSGAIAAALRQFSIDARVGQVAGEYCPGDYSVNGQGRVKLAGVAQRIGRHGYHLGAVISVKPSVAAAQAVATAYRVLGLPFEPSSFGSLADFSPDLDHVALRDALIAALAGLLPVQAGVSALTDEKFPGGGLVGDQHVAADKADGAEQAFHLVVAA
jgi:lipoate-protein ligase A